MWNDIQKRKHVSAVTDYVVACENEEKERQEASFPGFFSLNIFGDLVVDV